MDSRPDCGETVVGNAAEQLRISRVELGELQRIALCAAVEASPLRGRSGFGAARVLDDAVQADELGDHDLAHAGCPFCLVDALRPHCACLPALPVYLVFGGFEAEHGMPRGL